jgi:hypothetical protein
MGLGGAFGYMAIGVMFFIVLIMGSQIIHAANPPQTGDIVNCNDICDITEKHIVLDDWGMYDYYVSCSNDITYGVYNFDEYNKIPDKGSVWVRASSIRMRIGLTMESWLDVTYAPSNVQNACIITGGEVSEKKVSCLGNSKFNDTWKKTIKNTPFAEQGVCFINQTLGQPI